MTFVNGDEAAASGSWNLRGMRILLVEDSWQLGIALKSLLRSFDAEVDGPVATTTDAEHLIAEHVPDAAVVDINLRQGERSYGLIDR
jgi:DNA-binding response OmpR family regulator